MSKGRFQKLADAFDMPDLDDTLDQETPSTEDVAAALENARDLEKTFKKMDHYDTHDSEMDELAELAIEAHKSLQDLGMNVEIRHAGEIFTSSSQMLKIAVDAKNNKVEKKLKLLKLQLDKMKLDRMTEKDDKTVDGTAVKMDRNQLLEQLKNIQNNETK